jgi:hypothetical protein
MAYGEKKTQKKKEAPALRKIDHTPIRETLAHIE